jgi:hypothetical protein
MARTAKALLITPREVSLLEKAQRKRSLPEVIISRIKILLMFHQTGNAQAALNELKITSKTSRKWRDHWNQYRHKLDLWTQGEDGKGISDKALLDIILLLLKDAPGRGRKRTFTLAQYDQVVAS